MKIRKIIALALAAAMALVLVSCGSKPVSDDGKPTSGSTVTEQSGQSDISAEPTDKDKDKDAEKGIKITQTAAKSVQTEKFETADFSVTIPKGWTVTWGGTNIYHSIRISDPNEPLNQMFLLLKADILLHSQAGKDAWQQNYNLGNTQAALFAKRFFE